MPGSLSMKILFHESRSESEKAIFSGQKWDAGQLELMINPLENLTFGVRVSGKVELHQYLIFHREISSVLCDHLEGWDRESGRETQEGGAMGMYVYV